MIAWPRGRSYSLVSPLLELVDNSLHCLNRPYAPSQQRQCDDNKSEDLLPGGDGKPAVVPYLPAEGDGEDEDNHRQAQSTHQGHELREVGDVEGDQPRRAHRCGPEQGACGQLLPTRPLLPLYPEPPLDLPDKHVHQDGVRGDNVERDQELGHCRQGAQAPAARKVAKDRGVDLIAEGQVASEGSQKVEGQQSKVRRVQHRWELAPARQARLERREYCMTPEAQDDGGEGLGEPPLVEESVGDTATVGVGERGVKGEVIGCVRVRLDGHYRKRDDHHDYHRQAAGGHAEGRKGGDFTKGPEKEEGEEHQSSRDQGPALLPLVRVVPDRLDKPLSPSSKALHQELR
eukprot:Hpha_TRINITY_DN14450_c0_g1::TRINITY_DN14450_c0_g1_i1::g.158091::m.158091